MSPEQNEKNEKSTGSCQRNADWSQCDHCRFSSRASFVLHTERARGWAVYHGLWEFLWETVHADHTWITRKTYWLCLASIVCCGLCLGWLVVNLVYLFETWLCCLLPWLSWLQPSLHRLHWKAAIRVRLLVRAERWHHVSFWDGLETHVLVPAWDPL